MTKYTYYVNIMPPVRAGYHITIWLAVDGSRTSPAKEVRTMRLTIHIRNFVITVIVKKSENRHSGK